MVFDWFLYLPDLVPVNIFYKYLSQIAEGYFGDLVSLSIFVLLLREDNSIEYNRKK